MLIILFENVSSADVDQSAKMWDKFYNRNQANFFKDRHWIRLEFTEIDANMGTAEAPVSLFEVGCGVGNTFFPLLELCPHLVVYAVDFSANAIECIRKQERFEAARCHVWVCDVAREPLPAPIPLVDFATMVFVLSAMTHEAMPVAVRKIYDTLKPGGYVCFIRFGGMTLRNSNQ